MPCRALSLSIAAAILAGCGGSQLPIGAPNGTSDDGNLLPYHTTFRYTGKAQSFKVPAGVTNLTVVALGAAGAGESGSYHGYYEYYGRGSRVYAIIPVTPRETLYVFVGGQGSTIGGFNGGGNPGSDTSRRVTCDGGGGASDVRDGGHTLRDRVLVAAGGGGAGCGFYGGDGEIVFGGKGGRAVGEAGGSFYYGDESVGGGGGGTQTHGGAGGFGGGNGSGAGGSGQSGSLGRGGNGGAGGLDLYCNPSNYFCNGGGGAGGGGGYYGGGGGGGGAGGYDDHWPGAGGGGGSSYVEPYASRARLWRGWKTANGEGLVVFSWQ